MIRVFLTFLIFMMALPAQAHRPYYAQTEIFTDPDNNRLTMRLWHGDGIMTSDPVRAVVFNDQGQLLAVSPLASSLSLHCDNTGQERRCVAYDMVRLTVFVPDPSAYASAPWDWSDHQDTPHGYPEYWHRAEPVTGFSERPMSLFETARFSIVAIHKRLVFCALGIFWWTVIFAIVGPLVWRVFGKGRLGTTRPGALANVVLRLGLSYCLLWPVALFGIVGDPSPILIVLAWCLAFPLALRLTRPKALTPR